MSLGKGNYEPRLESHLPTFGKPPPYVWKATSLRLEGDLPTIRVGCSYSEGMPLHTDWRSRVSLVELCWRNNWNLRRRDIETLAAARDGRRWNAAHAVAQQRDPPEVAATERGPPARGLIVSRLGSSLVYRLASARTRPLRQRRPRARYVNYW